MSTKKSAVSHSVLLRFGFGLTLCFVVIIVGLAIYTKQQQEARANAQLFSDLQRDFRELQKEFNKIDPGWEYSEWCSTGGGVFDRDSDITCSIGLSNESVRHKSSASIDQYTSVVQSKYIVNDQINTLPDSEVNIDVVNESIDHGSCGMSFIQENDRLSAGISCRNNAERLYFSQRD